MPQDLVSIHRAIQVQTAPATPMLQLACAARRQPSVCRTISAFSPIGVLMGTSAMLEDPARMTDGILTFVPNTALLVGNSDSSGFLVVCLASGKIYTS